MKNKNKKSSEGLKSLSASLLCIFGGIFVGFVVLVLLSVFNPRIGFAEAVRGILIERQTSRPSEKYSFRRPCCLG